MSVQQRFPAEEIARLRVVASRHLLPAVLSFVRRAVEELGLNTTEQEKLCLLVEEASLNVIEHAFEPGERGAYDVVLEQRVGALVVAIEDRGLPFDSWLTNAELLTERSTLEGQDPTGTTHIGFRLMRAFADEVHIHNLGKEGKRVELLMRLPIRSIEEILAEEYAQTASKPLEDIPVDVPISLRLLRPDTQDAVALSRCIYRSYGYSYISSFLYYPETILERIQSGQMVSCVAVTPENEIVGHLALNSDHPDARVGETGQAVVDPRVRGRNLFKTMKEFLVTEAQRKNMVGIYSESVTIHPYTQKGNLSIGARETALLLSYIPGTISFRKIEGATSDQPAPPRQTALVYYLRVAQEPEREIYCPEHHREMVGRIYDENRMRRSFQPGWISPDSCRSQIDLSVRSEWSQAFMRVRAIGQGFYDLARNRLRELSINQIACIYIDLPLCLPAVPFACEMLERLGFSFSGVVPEYMDGDVLRLQYLNTEDYNQERMHLVTDFAKALHHYVMLERRRVESL